MLIFCAPTFFGNEILKIYLISSIVPVFENRQKVPNYSTLLDIPRIVFFDFMSVRSLDHLIFRIQRPLQFFCAFFCWAFLFAKVLTKTFIVCQVAIVVMALFRKIFAQKKITFFNQTVLWIIGYDFMCLQSDLLSFIMIMTTRRPFCDLLLS